MITEQVARAADVLGAATRVVVLTGAGVSAESGVATFRGAGGLWEGSPVSRVATPEAFAADPGRVWRFYESRRRQLAGVRPNPGHEVLARWQDRFFPFTLVTQNVDGLHQAAGSRRVLELHGSIWRIACTGCGRLREDRSVPLAHVPPRCVHCGGLERPDIVWFGEVLPADILSEAAAAARRCDVLIAIGTSAVVFPAAGLLHEAAAAGAQIIEVNPEESALAALAAVAVRAPSGVAVPLVDAALARR